MRKKRMVGEVGQPQTSEIIRLARKVGQLSTFEIVDEFSAAVPPVPQDLKLLTP